MQERKRNSLGEHYHNTGTKIKVNEGRYWVDTLREYYLLDVIPTAAPRMTRRDIFYTDPYHSDPKKRQRKIVTQYLAFKKSIKLQAALLKFTLPKVFEAVYFIPMPDTWSEKKKEKMNGLPHEQTPDTDNLTKALKDCLLDQDSSVWNEKAEKRWAYKGSIIIFV
jgi:Holliday junction resolvase RusA-like endonuclease